MKRHLLPLAIPALQWNSDKIRAQTALSLIELARRLLKLPRAASGDFDTCIYCEAPGCETGNVEHKPDCPSITGVFPVRLQDMWPGGPARCAHCETILWPGDSYSHIQLEGGSIPVAEIACTGCALLAGVEASA